LEPAVAVDRTTASVTYHHAGERLESETFVAWGRNAPTGQPATNALLLESALTLARGTLLYGRVERIDKDDLLPAGSANGGRAFPITKVTAGISVDIAEFGHARFSTGAQGSLHSVGAALAQDYGEHPWGASVYVRVRLVP
ncbi:MAG TPA: hypothetical protein VN787_02615, partial [Steroidobacteraceae bacterium]|nr:hypothetical protein [Steroidobacteraceae bacterium]